MEVRGVGGHKESIKTGVFCNLKEWLDILGFSVCQQRILAPLLAASCFLSNGYELMKKERQDGAHTSLTKYISMGS